MEPYKILVPVDFSDASAAALSLAMELAIKRQPSSISTLHVDQGLVPINDQALGILEPTRLLHSLRMQAMEELAPYDVPVIELVAYGDPLTKILECAQEWKYDLIVLGTKDRTGLERWVAGSVVDGVLRNSPCPVMCVKSNKNSTAPNHDTPSTDCGNGSESPSDSSPLVEQAKDAIFITKGG